MRNGRSAGSGSDGEATLRENRCESTAVVLLLTILITLTIQTPSVSLHPSRPTLPPPPYSSSPIQSILRSLTLPPLCSHFSAALALSRALHCFHPSNHSPTLYLPPLPFSLHCSFAPFLHFVPLHSFYSFIRGRTFRRNFRTFFLLVHASIFL